MIELVKVLAGFGKQAWNFFFSPRYYCWQTFVWLTLFSTIVSALATGMTRTLISTLGYGFLIIGFTWAGVTYGLVFTHWITSAMILHLLSGVLPIVPPTVWLVLWLPLAAIIHSLPIFFDCYLVFRWPGSQARLNFFILLGSQVLLACWLQFAITINGWLKDYPSLLNDDFNRSLLIVRVESLQPEAARAPRSEVVLTALQPLVEEQLEAQPWAVLQPALLNGTWAESVLPELRQQVLDGQYLGRLPENPLWDLAAQVEPRPLGVQLAIATRWQGPRSQPATIAADPYRALLICQVEPALDRGPATQAACTTPGDRRALNPEVE